MYRYYSTLRPVGPGTFPGRPESITNFDDRTYCEEIGREAWGYIEYKEPLSAEETAACDLTPAGMKTYWCVTTAIDDYGRIISHITATVESACKPENSCASTRRKDIYLDWFDSLKAAQDFVEESKRA